MNKFFLVGLMGLCLIAASVSHAEIEAGDFRISAGIFAGGYSELDIEGATVETGGVRTSSSLSAVDSVFSTGGVVQLGYAPVEMFEVGLGVSLGYTKVDLFGDDADAASLGLVPYAALNLAIGEFSDSSPIYFSPGLGLGYQGVYTELFDAHQFKLEVGAEMKFFVAKDASVDLGLFFDYSTGEADLDGGGHFDIDGWSIGPRLKISIWP